MIVHSSDTARDDDGVTQALVSTGHAGQRTCEVIHSMSGIDRNTLNLAKLELGQNLREEFDSLYNGLLESDLLVSRARETLGSSPTDLLIDLGKSMQTVSDRILDTRKKIIGIQDLDPNLKVFLKTTFDYSSSVRNLGAMLEVIGLSKSHDAALKEGKFIGGVKLSKATEVEIKSTVEGAAELCGLLANGRVTQEFDRTQQILSTVADHLESILSHGIQSATTSRQKGLAFFGSADEIKGRGRPVCTTSDLTIPKRQLVERARGILGDFDARSPRGVLLERHGEQIDDVRLGKNLAKIESRLANGILILSQVDHGSTEDFRNDTAWFHGFDVSYPPGPMVSQVPASRIFAVIVPQRFQGELSPLEDKFPGVKFQYVRNYLENAGNVDNALRGKKFNCPDFLTGIKACLISIYPKHGLRGLKGTILGHMTRLSETVVSS